MDIATLGGLVVGVGAIVIAFLMEGGHLSMVDGWYLIVRSLVASFY
jgi:flagellar motor component MotA